jgi:hypothetical protein
LIELINFERTDKYGAIFLILSHALKTVELIVERTEWTPPPPRYTADALVYLRIVAADMPMRLKVKEAGGRWNQEKRLWLVNYGKIAGTALEKHIQVDAS